VSDPNLESVLNHNVKNNFFNYDNWNARKNKIVLIAANKVSPTSNSNYKLRRKIAKLLSSQEIDIYGGLWNASLRKRMSHRLAVGLYSIRIGFVPNLISLYGSLFSKYNNHLGEPENKHLIIQKYKYSLVIENSSDYCSEKLFDAIINGSIPIYVGPKNNEIFLPGNLYYSCDGSVDEIRKIINSQQEKTVNDMLNSMKTFLQSKNFKENWSGERVYEAIAQKINNFWGTK
jgi:hypothetical protein